MNQVTREAYVTGYPAFDCATLQPHVLRSTCDCKLAAAAATSDQAVAICSPNCFFSKVTVVGDAAHPMSPFKGEFPQS
jgi:2-polyprenyl-6-methoxyphenol hydroxylase-like FAD-dependent oxidoreductase